MGAATTATTVGGWTIAGDLTVDAANTSVEVATGTNYIAKGAYKLFGNENWTEEDFLNLYGEGRDLLYMGAYGYAEFGANAMAAGYSSQKSVGASGAGGKYSAFGEMSESDGIRYNQWMKFREAGLDQAKINDIILTNKGMRPNPNTYLSETYINNHLKQFDGGVTKIMTQAPSGTAGPPGGTFVMPSSVADDLITRAGGDISKLEKMLSLEQGTLGTLPVRVDVKYPSNIRIPSGNELGANSQWLPGGNTGGGIPEATITSPKKGEYIVKPIK